MNLQENIFVLSPSFGQFLVEKGFISSDQQDIITKEATLCHRSFEDCLISLGFMSESAFAEALSLFSGYEHINLKNALLDPSLKELVSRSLAIKYTFIPLSYEQGILRIVLADAYDLRTLDALRMILPVSQIIPLIASHSDVLESIDTYYGYDLSIQGTLKEIESTSHQAFTRDDAINPTIRLVNLILIDAIRHKASDIHFEPEGAFTRLRYRIDGILSQVCTFHSSYWPAICVRLKVMSGMNIAESRKPQDGRITFTLGTREIDLRVSSHPTIHGENVVVRILDKSRSLLSLDELGYSPEVIRRIKQVLEHSEGLFIITGPTGCGKTTSLYSILSHMNASTMNIMTLEEPVEYKLPRIRQSDIRELGGIDFAEGVRSILRQDPDIILIGEIRDTPTAQMALRASMTGHQVFSTLHTNDSVGAINRLLDLGLSHTLLSGNLQAIVAQRLVRRLCSLCKIQKNPDPKWIDYLKISDRFPLFFPRGCEACRGTGYRGRFALAEILVFDGELNELLGNAASRTDIYNMALRKGFSPLVVDAQQRVLKGDTSPEEVLCLMDLEPTT